MYYKSLVIVNKLMKKLLIMTMPLILSMSLMLGLDSTNSNIYGQQDNQTMQQAQQQMQQAQQQMQQANQTMQQANQTSPQNNQTSQTEDKQIHEKLLNMTNQAIIALNDNNDTAVGQSLTQIQNELINATGQPVVIIPSAALNTESDSDSE